MVTGFNTHYSEASVKMQNILTCWTALRWQVRPNGEVKNLIRRMLFITSIVILAILMAACAPAANESGETPAANGEQPGGSAVTEPAGEEAAANECADIDAQTLAQTGNDVYSTRCASCHGAQGEGVGTFPGLAGIESLNAADGATTLQTFFNPEVHPFLDDITNQDVAAVLTFVRGSFGNTGTVVCPELVETIRPSQ